MSNEINQEEFIQRRAMELMPKELEKCLTNLMAKYREKAAALAEKHVFATSGQPRSGFSTYFEACMQLDREAEDYRRDALELLGRIEGLRVIKSQMFGAMGIQGDNLTVDRYAKKVHDFIKAPLETAHEDAQTAMLATLHVSPSHPSYAEVRGKAISASAVRDGILDVLKEADNLAERIVKMAAIPEYGLLEKGSPK
jgi:hypothetical protein